MKRKIKPLLKAEKFNFGDYVLFQEYIQDGDSYRISRPILAIHLGYFVADQAIGFDYIIWNNDRHTVYITNEHVTNYPVCKRAENINDHVEWMDYIDVLGHWKSKPNWRQILHAYRNQNHNEVITEDDLDIDYGQPTGNAG